MVLKGGSWRLAGHALGREVGVAQGFEVAVLAAKLGTLVALHGCYKHVT